MIVRRYALFFAGRGNFGDKFAVSMVEGGDNEAFLGHFVLFFVKVLAARFAMIVRRHARFFAGRGNFGYKFAVSMFERGCNDRLFVGVIDAVVSNRCGEFFSAFRFASRFEDRFSRDGGGNDQRLPAVLVVKRDRRASVFRPTPRAVCKIVIGFDFGLRFGERVDRAVDRYRIVKVFRAR